MTLTLESIEGGEIEFEDDDTAVALKLVAGDDHRADRAGLRRFMDGIGMIRYEVMSQRLRAKREAREATSAPSDES
jgi:hypothetical protein